jgi:hypothetical protein
LDNHEKDELDSTQVLTANYIHPHAADLIRSAAAEEGESLPASIRYVFESMLNVDLSDVRIHVGIRAAEAAQTLNASAYTIGHDIFFAAGAFTPHNLDGLQLIAHEVAHAVQQGGVAVDSYEHLPVSRPGDSIEQEADRFAVTASCALANLAIGGVEAQRVGLNNPMLCVLRVPVLGQTPPGIFRQRGRITDEMRQLFIGREQVSLLMLLTIYQDSFLPTNESRLTPARIPDVGSWHRMLPRQWLQGHRSVVLEQFRTRFANLVRSNDLQDILNVEDQIRLVQPQSAITSLCLKMRAFAEGRLREIIFPQPPSTVFSDQVPQYDTFAGAMNVFRDVVISGSTMFRGATSIAAQQAARDALHRLSSDQRHAVSQLPNHERVRAALNVEGRNQLREIARRREFSIPPNYPEQAIR